MALPPELESLYATIKRYLTSKNPKAEWTRDKAMDLSQDVYQMKHDRATLVCLRLIDDGVPLIFAPTYTLRNDEGLYEVVLRSES